LSQFIEPENIPKKYGGELPFEFGGRPILDGKIDDTLTWTDAANAAWPQGPTKWARRGDGTWDLTAVGSVGGKERRQVVASFKPDPLPLDEETKLAEVTSNMAIEQKSHEEAGRVPNGTAMANPTTSIPNDHTGGHPVNANPPAEPANAPVTTAAAHTGSSANIPTGSTGPHIEPVPLAAQATSLPRQSLQEKIDLTPEQAVIAPEK
jgi:hypothetical protein